VPALIITKSTQTARGGRTNVYRCEHARGGIKLDARKTAGIFGLAVGLTLIAVWTIQLARDAVPEVQTEGPHLLFVLGAELLTAELLVVAGVGLLGRQPWADRASLFATGMLCYSILNHTGAWVQAGAYG
jgi:hypothetical protein